MPPVNRPVRLDLLDREFDDLISCWELDERISSASDTIHWVDKRLDVADADFEV